MFFTNLRLVILCTITILKPCISLNMSVVSFNEAFSPLYGNQNVAPSDDGKSVQISINRWSTSGSGFISRYTYSNGVFTAFIKLPNNSYTAGVVASFYLQNNEAHPDEIDFEFLGHIDSEKWTVQTNVYGNGSYNRGREERFLLPFDPTKDFHNYTILWNLNRVIFFVDHLPIREVENLEGMRNDFPTKPMYVYGTIWDGSDWATDDGKNRIDLQRGPFVTSYYFIINGCRNDQDGLTPPECNVELPSGISTDERLEMIFYRAWLMTYSYCHDKVRYPDSFPECAVESSGMPPVDPPVSRATQRFIYC